MNLCVICKEPAIKKTNHLGNTFYISKCSFCVDKIKRNLPDYVTKEWVENKHYVENLTKYQLADLLNVKLSISKWLFNEIKSLSFM